MYDINRMKIKFSVKWKMIFSEMKRAQNGH